MGVRCGMYPIDGVAIVPGGEYLVALHSGILPIDILENVGVNKHVV